MKKTVRLSKPLCIQKKQEYWYNHQFEFVDAPDEGSHEYCVLPGKSFDVISEHRNEIGIRINKRDWTKVNGGSDISLSAMTIYLGASLGIEGQDYRVKTKPSPVAMTERQMFGVKDNKCPHCGALGNGWECDACGEKIK